MNRRAIVLRVLIALCAVGASAQTANLFEIVDTGSFEAVQAAIRAGADVNARDMADRTPVMWACFAQRYDVALLLVAAGADINAQDGPFGQTALMWAIMYCEAPNEIIKILEIGADARLKDKKGRTALDYARENWRFEGTEAMRRLLEASR